MRKSRFLVNPGILFFISAALIAVILAVLFSIAKDVQQLNRQGDAALFEQLVENIHAGKGAVSNVFANTQNFIERGYAFSPLSVLITKDLEPPATSERNMLKFHAYYILYFIAPFVQFIPSSLLLAIVQAICFFGLLLAAATFVYKETKNAVVTVLLLLVVFANANWIGGFQGQFYPDRLFVLAGFLLGWLAYKKASLRLLVLIAAITATINERAALIGGLVVLLAAVDGDSIRVRDRKFWTAVILGGLMLVYAYVQKTYVLDNLYYGGYLPRNLEELVARLMNEEFLRNIRFFALNNAFLILLSCASPRLALLAFIVMMPNIIGNIGGAEKTGWLTHYHSYYFPILVFSAAAGCTNIYLAYTKTKQVSLRFASLILLPAAILFVWASEADRLAPRNGLFIADFIKTSRNNFSDWRFGRPTGYAIREQVHSLFHEGELVSVDELGMALLHDRVKISVFPVAIEKADALFIPCKSVENDSNRSDESLSLSRWISNKGFNDQNVTRVDAISYCRIQKLKK